MNNWGGLDFFIFLIFIMNTILGLARGASKEILSMISLNVALIFMIKFTLPLTAFLDSSPLTQNVLTSPLIQNFMTAIGAGHITEGLLHELTYSLSLVICFIGAYSACEAVVSITSAIELMNFTQSTWNRKIGGSFGFIRGYVLNVILILVLAHLYALSGALTNSSQFVKIFTATAKKVDILIGKQDVEHYKDIYQDKDLIKKEEMIKAVSPPSLNSFPTQSTP